MNTIPVPVFSAKDGCTAMDPVCKRSADIPVRNNDRIFQSFTQPRVGSHFRQKFPLANTTDYVTATCKKFAYSETERIRE